MPYHSIKDIKRLNYDINDFLGLRNNWYTFSWRIIALLIEGLIITLFLMWLNYLL